MTGFIHLTIRIPQCIDFGFCLQNGHFMSVMGRIPFLSTTGADKTCGAFAMAPGSGKPELGTIALQAEIALRRYDIGIGCRGAS